MEKSTIEQRRRSSRQRTPITAITDWQVAAINENVRRRPDIAHTQHQTPTDTQERTPPHATPSATIGLISEGIDVVCRDGKAGRVVHVLSDPQQGCPSYIVVRQGWFRSRCVRVPLDWVTAITPERLVLNRAKRDLACLPTYRSDGEIKEAVKHAFYGTEMFYDRADYLAIKVAVQNGVVELRGNVRNSARRLDAEQLVRRVRGVTDVLNLLHADDEIAWKVEWLLKRTPQLEMRKLHVQSYFGLVRISGAVPSASQRALATSLVQQTPGVHAVNNALVIDMAATPPVVPTQVVEPQHEQPATAAASSS